MSPSLFEQCVVLLRPTESILKNCETGPSVYRTRFQSVLIHPPGTLRQTVHLKHPNLNLFYDKMKIDQIST